MQVIRAAEMGMCFGVRDALQVAHRVSQPELVTIHGELVHNAVVNERLASAGFQQLAEDKRQQPITTPLVLITAHGVSQRERGRLSSDGKRVIDTTCPLVRRAHQAAMELQAEDRHVLLIGKVKHVEVQGIVEDLNSYEIVTSTDDITQYPQTRLGLVSQTTMPPDLVDAIRDKVALLNPETDIRFIDTVCLPTKLRQTALLELLDLVEAVVVVGGQNSNNTRRLVRLCEQNSKPAHHVERASQLRSDWFRGMQTVGLTAGTSTLDETIDGVHQALLDMPTADTASSMERCNEI